MKLKYIIIFLSFVFSVVSCDSPEKFIGKYQAAAPKTKAHSGTFIELMEHGEGVWKRHDEEVSFTWYIKNKELRINTKEGGIMVGKLGKRSFTIDLPGDTNLTFVKVIENK